jgi:SAM-dependent methyltransferase
MPTHDGPRKRRALTHVGGPTETEGDPDAARKLAQALDVEPPEDDEDDPSRAHVHGFHPYPARMHPATAARLVRAFAPPGGRVLDPFCGSGTVLVEAAAAGRHALGVDLNPLAVRLARCKTRPRTPPELDHLVAKARECAAHADARRKGKAGATRRFPAEDVKLFEPHVLLELDSLRDKIEQLGHDPARPDLLLVLSSLLVKLSRKRGDTAENKEVKRTRAGFAAALFAEKGEDLARRLAAFRDLLPAPAPEVVVEQDDAIDLKKVPPDGVTAIVTSPPYAATYDYVSHHALRMRWLGLDPAPLVRGEIGSRATYRRLTAGPATDRWAKELGRFVGAARRVLPPGGPVVIVVADSAVDGVALRADAIVARVSRANGFEPVARASQPRPHFHGPTAAAFRDRPRLEHALLLRKESPRPVPVAAPGPPRRPRPPRGPD